MDWGLVEALSTMVTAAVRVPVAVGVNVTPIEQFDPAATLPPQVLVAPKSAAFVPETLMLLTLSAALPVLESVTVCVALEVPVFCEAKVRL